MRSVVGGLVLVGMLALTGCVEGDRIPTLPPTPTSTPIFASDEEALAAAEDAYAAYNEVSALIAMDGGADPERIAPFVTEDQLENELATYALYQEQQVHAEGRSTITRIELQQASEMAGIADIAIYACLDVTAVRILDSAGRDVTPPDRPSLVALEVSFEGHSLDELRVASSDIWSDSSFCAG